MRNMWSAASRVLILLSLVLGLLLFSAGGSAAEPAQAEIASEITRGWVVAAIGVFIVFIPLFILLTIPIAKPLGLRGNSWLSLLLSALPFAQIGLLAVFFMKIPPGFDLKLNLIFIVPAVVVSLIAAPFAVYINNRG